MDVVDCTTLFDKLRADTLGLDALIDRLPAVIIAAHTRTIQIAANFFIGLTSQRWDLAQTMISKKMTLFKQAYSQRNELIRVNKICALTLHRSSLQFSDLKKTRKL
ncbi:MAG TPA: hypothetical protein VF393_04940 [archaeon]